MRSMPGLVAAALLAVACGDGAGGTPDARPMVADAPLASPDAPALDAPTEPDAPPGEPDAPPPGPDAAPADAETAPEPAELILNEVLPSGAGGADLVELLAVRAGSTRDYTLWQNYTVGALLLARLPTVAVDSGHLIVVHLRNADVLTETTARDECADPACYDGAWDVAGEVGADKHIGHSYRLIYLLDADQAFADAVPFMVEQDLGGGKPQAFPTDLEYITGQGPPENPGIEFWKTLCPAPCDYDNLENMFAASVSWGGTGMTPDGPSIQRKAGAPNTHTVDDWNETPAPASFGELNP